jgi:hypothetical protein
VSELTKTEDDEPYTRIYCQVQLHSLLMRNALDRDLNTAVD